MFLWSFWYIICIFWFYLNYLWICKALVIFWNFEITNRFFLHWLNPRPRNWPVGPWLGQLPWRQDQVNHVDWSRWWHHQLRTSHLNLEFDDSIRIGTCGCVHSNQKIKSSMRVPALLGFGPQNLAGGELTRWPETVCGDSELQTMLSSNKGVQRCASSPGFFQ
jgi:hypothetical protein